MLPKAGGEGVMLVDLESHQAKHLSTADAVRSLKTARSEGNEVWIVVRVVK